MKSPWAYPENRYYYEWYVDEATDERSDGGDGDVPGPGALVLDRWPAVRGEDGIGRPDRVRELRHAGVCHAGDGSELRSIEPNPAEGDERRPLGARIPARCAARAT